MRCSQRLSRGSSGIFLTSLSGDSCFLPHQKKHKFCVAASKLGERLRFNKNKAQKSQCIDGRVIEPQKLVSVKISISSISNINSPKLAIHVTWVFFRLLISSHLYGAMIFGVIFQLQLNVDVDVVLSLQRWELQLNFSNLDFLKVLFFFFTFYHGDLQFYISFFWKNFLPMGFMIHPSLYFFFEDVFQSSSHQATHRSWRAHHETK